MRETLFNWLGQELDGWHCLDLFAGSGALGFPAASRGAARVVMIEKAPRVLAALHENHELLHKPSAVEVQRVGMRYNIWLFTKAQFDLIFIDPPYKKGWIPRLEGLLPRVMKRRVISSSTRSATLGRLANHTPGQSGRSPFSLVAATDSLKNSIIA